MAFPDGKIASFVFVGWVSAGGLAERTWSGTRLSADYRTLSAKRPASYVVLPDRLRRTLFGFSPTGRTRGMMHETVISFRATPRWRVWLSCVTLMPGTSQNGGLKISLGKNSVLSSGKPL